MNVLKSFDYPFVLLGDRNYVHSTTQTEGIIKAVKYWSLCEINHMVGNFHTVIMNECRYDLFANAEKKDLTKSGYATIYRIICKDQPHIVGLLPRAEKVVKSVAYDEDQLISGCEIDKKNKTAGLITDKNHLINKIIALNKQMHNQLFNNKGFSSWFCSRFELNWNQMATVEINRFEIRLLRDLRSLYTKSSIATDQRECGYIYFSRSMRHDRN
jgi:hypothetical protein